VASPIDAKTNVSISSPIKELTRTTSNVQQAPEPSLKEYKAQFLSSDPEAREVLASIGAIMLLLPIPASPDYPSTPAEKVSLMEYMSAVNEIKDAIEDIGGGRDVGSLFVLQPSVPASEGDGKEVVKRLEGLVEKFEDKCHEMGVFGWDFVAWDGVPPVPSEPGAEILPKRNQYGEKQGLARISEVLEAVNWAASPAAGTLEDDGGKDDDDADFDVFSGIKYAGLDAELQQEMMGLKLSMLETHNTTDCEGQKGTGVGLGLASEPDPGPGQDGEDMSIEQMSKLMERVVAIKEAGSEMGVEERQQFARREVQRLMKEL
jgi:hypothetical protein